MPERVVCEVPCKTVKDELRRISDAIKEKVSLKIFMWVIAGIVVLSGVLVNAKVETIQVKISTLSEAVNDIKKEVKSMNGHKRTWRHND